VNTDEFGKLFETFRSLAFRLETLPEYRVPQDVESLRLFREGQPPPESRRERPWLQTIRNANARGARMQRVRVIRGALTEYQRFQFAWGYPDNLAAGEDIRILDQDVPGVLDHDYWLFDDATVVRMDYDNEGQFLRPVVVDDVALYRRCGDVALAHAVPFSDYLSRMEDRPSLSRPY